MLSVVPGLLLGLALLAPQAAPPSNPEFQRLAEQAAAALDSNPAQATQLYQQALKLNPNWPEGWFYLGASEYQQRHFREAAIAFTQATALAPQNGPAWSFLGLSEFELRAYQEALTHLQKGIGLGMEGNARFSSAAHTCLASLLSKEGDFSGALAQLAPLAKRDDQSGAVLLAFGVAVLQRTLFPSEIRPEQKPLIEAAGKAVWALYADQPERALGLFRSLAAEYPKESGVHYAYGMALVMSDPDQALVELRRELSLNGRQPNAAVQASLLDLKNGTPEGVTEAVRFAETAVEAQPKYSLAHAALGRALLKQGRLEPAAAEMEIAIQLDASNAQYHLFLQQIYTRLGRSADAEREKATFQRLHAEATPSTALLEPGLASGGDTKP